MAPTRLPEYPEEQGKAPYEPAFNVPRSVLILSIVIIAIHAGSQFLTLEKYYALLAMFAFIPAAWSGSPEYLALSTARYWAPFTYFFLHGDWIHVLANLTWFAAFGSAVARRFQTSRFLVFLALSSLAAALAHAVFNPGNAAPVIGASGAVSACMGAAVRFAFTPNVRDDAALQPALPLLQSFNNRGVLSFVVLWFVFNWLFGAGVVQLPGVEGQIAWEAHMGGFVFGLLAFKLFDPVQA